MITPLDADARLLSINDGNQKERHPNGHLTALPTKAEVEARFKPVQAFIATVSAKTASSILKAVDNALREAQPANMHPLYHLRRFVKVEHLPEYLKNELAKPPSLQLAGMRDEQEDPYDDSAGTTSDGPSLHLLVCATTDLAFDRIQALLIPNGLSSRKSLETKISTITVPGLPPTSEDQASRWSREYWPTIYKKHNPFGAQPAFVSRAAAEISGEVDGYMALAREVGEEASDAGIGENIGVVVVDRTKAGGATIIMATCDARWNTTGKCHREDGRSGNVMAHSVMRAIGLIAKKRLDVLSNPTPTKNDVQGSAFADVPLTPLEKATYIKSTVEAGGYLCLGLEFYLTHEPCVMCSMALLHSRVGRVVFGQRMLLTGALTAGDVEGRAGEAPGLGYGLFWRPSLNWKFLTWQWDSDDACCPRRVINEDIHA